MMIVSGLALTLGQCDTAPVSSCVPTVLRHAVQLSGHAPDHNVVTILTDTMHHISRLQTANLCL